MDLSPRIELALYSESFKEEWDRFVDISKNGTFLFRRDFMDYHADRFPDTSLVFFHKDKMVGLLPASIKDNRLVSHPGLTYGGFVTTEATYAADLIRMLDLTLEFCKAHGLTGLEYKAVPYIYHRVPAQEDLYALFLRDARLSARSISSVIRCDHRPGFTSLRKRGVRRALNAGLSVRESEDLSSFWEILSQNLTQRYAVSPVHSLSEIQLLKKRFPENIRLFACCEGEMMLAGILCFVTRECFHVQYISAGTRGKELGALDLLFAEVIPSALEDHTWFDFGTSTERGGHYLNEGLLHQKEGFGARAVCYDTYTLNVKR